MATTTTATTTTTLTGKVAVVTGSGQGLGKAIAKRLAEAGAIVVINDRNATTAEATAKEIGPSTMFYVADVSDSKQVDAMYQAVFEKYQRLDISVNNAGVAQLGEAWEISDEDWNRLISINLSGMYWCVRAAVRIMKEQKSGVIVNMSSVCGRVGRPFVSPAYSASKAGVVGLTMSVARSVADYGIRVNAIAPGPIRTELQSSFPEEKMNILRQNFPLGWGSAVDVAESVLYLVSDGSKWMTGSCLDLNGGHLMG